MTALSVDPLRPEKEECPKYTKDHVHQKPERGEVEVKFPVVGAEGEDLEHGEHAGSKDVDGPQCGTEEEVVLESEDPVLHCSSDAEIHTGWIITSFLYY